MRPTTTLSPRFARLVRESWWLIVVAAFLWLALILATYTRDDPAWSTSGIGAPIANKGGVAGAWLADLLFYLFGVSAWWWVVAGVVLVVAGYRRIGHPERAREHPLGLGILGFGLVLRVECRTRGVALYWLPLVLPQPAGGVFGDVIGRALVALAGFNGATLFLLALFLVGWSLFSGMSWLRLMERIGAGLEGSVAWLRRRAEERRDRELGEQALAERDAVVHAKQDVVFHEPVVVVPPAAELPKSERVVKEKQRPLFVDMPDSPLPPLALLDDAPSAQEVVSAETLEFTSRLIERKLADFGVAVRVLAAYPGPVITRFEIEPAVGVKGAQIVNLMKDLARALSVVSIRVVETIPGKSCMGLELPNPKRQIVKLVEILSSTTYNDTTSPLTLALGKDIAGKPVIADLARMPHLLVAGTTGSGKSVAVNAMILSLLYKAEPKQVRLILIDPKMLELSVYEGIPHLLAPVVTDMKLAGNALNWCVGEMERRYQLMSTLGVRNLGGYNNRIVEAKKAGKPLTNPFSLTPEDAGADRGDAAHRRRHRRARRPDDGDRQEDRGADRADRAKGARRRHPPDPRDAAAVGRRDHRAHQGEHSVADRVPGREQGRFADDPRSHGRGDAAGAGRHALPAAGCRLSAARARRVRLGCRSAQGRRASEGAGRAAIPRGHSRRSATNGNGDDGIGVEGADAESDPMYDQAVALVLQTRRPSISLVQRHLRIGYNRAARLIEQMERAGLVSPMQTNGNRDVLVPPGKGARAEWAPSRRAALVTCGVSPPPNVAVAGPVLVYREGAGILPEGSSRRRAPRITADEAAERAKALLPKEFCGPDGWVDGCDYDPEFALDSWRVYVRQWKRIDGRKQYEPREHSFVVLDPVGNCLANIPGT